MTGRCLQYACGMHVQEINNEVVRMQGCKLVGFERLCREILQVERYEYRSDSARCISKSRSGAG